MVGRARCPTSTVATNRVIAAGFTVRDKKRGIREVAADHGPGFEGQEQGDNGGNDRGQSARSDKP